MPQPDLLHPVPDRRHEVSGLAFGDAVHHRVVGLCRPADYADRGVSGLVGGVGTTGWSA